MEALSPTMEEGQLVRWLKSEGDTISEGDILAEIETDKATMELVARGEGVLRKILLQEGGTTPVGEVIAVIAGVDEDISGVVGDVGVVVAAESDQGPNSEAATAGPEKVAPSPTPPEPDTESSGARVKASPVAKRMAADAAVDLSQVRGSGPGGRIIKRDVEEAQGTGALGHEGPPAGSAVPALARPGPEGAEYEDLPLSQMRKTIARRLVESLGPVPHFFLRITVDMSRILEARRRVNSILESEGEKVSINDFLLRGIAEALYRHPEVNAHWLGDAIRRHFRVHLGVAVAVEDGLITPVIRDANLKGLAEISREVRALAARGKEKRLQPEEYMGSTFSVSNLGMFGIHEFTGVINPPEAGIIAVGGLEETPVATDGQVAVRPMMKMTMSCDHRVIDGATGARFLQTLKGMLEEPAAILL